MKAGNANYGISGIQNGANIPFTINSDCDATRFEYSSTSHVLNVQAAPWRIPAFQRDDCRNIAK